MLEIRFRAWDKKKNDWFDEDSGHLYIELNGNINFGWNGEIMDDYTDRIILMRYTGLKDVKGVEIYEGDILKAIVSFDNVRRTLKLNMEVYDINHMFVTDRDFDRYEVIGNIYENMELLED